MSHLDLPTTPTSSRFGWPMHLRLEEFSKLLQAESLPTFRIEFQARIQDFPIIRVSLSLPKYRLANGRTASAQDEFLAKNEKERRDLFSGDPEMLDAQQVQHQLLTSLARQAELLAYFTDPVNHQIDPIVLDELGFVVNGNRRLATWRNLHETDPKKYGHFAYVDVVVLPHCDEREIDRLEATLQIKKDIKADYTWDAEANMMLLKRSRDGFSDKELADMYGRKEGEIRELVEMRNYAADYLRSRGKQNHWSLVSDHEFAFRKLVVSRAKVSSLAEQELFKQATFALIDKPEEAGRRLYEVIPEIQENLPRIRDALQNRFRVTPVTKDGSSDVGKLFGETKATPTDAIALPLSAEIQKEDNIAEARNIIVEVVEAQRQIKRDSKQANQLLDACARANRTLAEAVFHSLRPEANRGGVKEQIDEIRKHIETIEKWLANSTDA